MTRNLRSLRPTFLLFSRPPLIGGANADAWPSNPFRVIVPAKKPAAVVDPLGADIAKTMRNPIGSQRLADNGVEPQGTRDTECAAFFKSEWQRYNKVALERGIHFEEETARTS